MRKPPPHPPAAGGVLDLRSWDMAAGRPTTLHGEWAFYPSVLLGQDGDTDASTITPVMEQMPTRSHSSAAAHLASGYGSFRLRILLPPGSNEPLGLRLLAAGSASAIYVNGQLVGQSGQPATAPAAYTARNAPYSVFFVAAEPEIDVVIEVANYQYHRQPGIGRPVLFGTATAIDKEQSLQQALQLALVIVMAIHALYGLLLYAAGMRDRLLIYFALSVMAVCLFSLLVDDKLLLTWLPLDYGIAQKLYYVTVIGCIVLYPAFVAHLSLGTVKTLWFHRVALAGGVVACLVLIIPLSWLPRLVPVLSLGYLAAVALAPFLLIRAALRHGRRGLMPVLLAIAFTINVGWGVAQEQTGLYWGFYPFDFLIAFVAFAFDWFASYVRNADAARRLAAELQSANDRKDQFLAKTSHELRNPLHGILNVTHSLLEQEPDRLSPKQRSQLELLHTVGRRMSILVNDLLDFTRLREQKLVLRPQPLHVSAVVTGVCDLLSYTVPSTSVPVVNAVPASFPPVLADENRLTQSMYNLLHNAMKFTERGAVTVTAAVDGQMAAISVTDTGPGIAAETMERIFDAYEQGQSAAAAGAGLGLGLAISHKLVAEHGGTLTVSSSPGRGSVFTFTLPLAETAADQVAAATEPAQVAVAGAKEPASATVATTSPAVILPSATTAQATPAATADRTTATPATGGRLAVLAVDDDPVNLAVIEDLLDPDAYDVVTASSGAAALALLDTKQWSLVITDAMMPHMSGYELTRRVRERYSVAELPVLMLTARTQPNDLDAAFRAGANDFVTKPVDALELRARVSALANLTEAARQRLRLETAVLQAQIQPHFLFNTLNSIAALSEVDPERMRALLTAFGNYLQASFDFQNLARLAPLKHELELVQSYLYIQSERFGERLAVQWHVDEQLAADRSIQLPPLTIQPLVENAVTHGALARLRGGHVRLQIARHGSAVRIAVPWPVHIPQVAGRAAAKGTETAGDLLQPTQNRARRSNLRAGRRASHGTL